MKASRLLGSAIALVVIATLGFGLFKLFTAKPTVAQMVMPPSAVTVATPICQTVIDEELFTGTTEAVQRVQVRARVQGYLRRIHFQDGSDVRKGDLLFEIEPESFEAKRDQAVASLKSSEAELARAQSDFDRVREAIKTNAVSQQEFTTKAAELDKANAAVLAARAALAEAELQLGYTRIVSPLDGRISRRFVDEGNLVGAGEQTSLATIVQLSPMYVQFYAGEGFVLENAQPTSSGDPTVRPLAVGLEGETGYPHEGILNYRDNTVDTGTGTILLRGELPNEDKKILPGMFVRVRVPMGERPNTLLVQDAALCTDLGGKYLLLVNDKDVVERCPVKVGRQMGELRIVLSGLSAGDRYITKGIQSAFPGTQVVPQLEGAGPGPAPTPAQP